jgi:hypothetical protein
MTPERLGMSEREYAAHAGISRGAVQKARASGRLVLHGDGSIDAAAVRSSLYLTVASVRGPKRRMDAKNSPLPPTIRLDGKLLTLSDRP